MRKWLLITSLGLSCAACSKKEDAEPDGVRIRVRNASPYVFESVDVDTSDGKNTYSQLAPGQSSDYKLFASAYRVAYARVIINGQTVVWQPVDYVGEKKLENGRYTYVLGIEDLANRRTSFQLEKN
jgi:hypothetical protein